MAAEGVEGQLSKLRLSEAEKKTVKLKSTKVSSVEVGKMRAIGKLLSEKPAKSENIEQTLGRVWCPHDGVECKEMGMNRFLFTFGNAKGKKRALEDGPWMYTKELLVMEDLVARKSLEEYEFKYIPIWVRAYGVPLDSITTRE